MKKYKVVITDYEYDTLEPELRVLEQLKWVRLGSSVVPVGTNYPRDLEKHKSYSC
nr:hypothetical protein [Fredinandcohnia onubensis]